MPLRPVPWATSGGADGQGGAENSVELARVGMYAGTGAATGIIEPGDFKVSALPVPGAAVRASKGTGSIKSTYPGVFGQSYAVQEQSHEDIPVAATGSSGGAKKYVYVLIEDTQYLGQAPDSVEHGPYNDYHVTTTLPQNEPYLLLAEINQPKSTATITNAMITDRREIAVPKTKPELRTYALLAEDTETLATVGSDNSTGETWPRQADTVQEPILIPDWATRVRIVQTWAGVLSPASRTTGRVWLQIGGDGNPNNVKTQTVKYASGPTDSRDPIIVADMKWIPPELRGTRQKFIPRGNRESGSGGVMTLDGASAIVTQLEFLQQVE